MARQPPDVSIVIANWNTRQLLRDCLASVYDDLAHAPLSGEVIVVDNGSNDGSAEMVALNYPEVLLILNQVNVGYAKANNQGIARAKGRYILLLNSDTIVRRGAPGRMVQYLDDHHEVGVVGPKVLNTDGSVQRSCWPFPMKVLLGNAFFLFQLRVLDDYRDWDHRRDRQVDYVASVAILVRREIFESVGLLDERFFHYGAEVEWAKRASYQRWRFVALAEPEITHMGGQSGLSRPGIAKLMQKDVRDSSVLYFRKHHGIAGLMLYYALTLSRGILSLLFWWSLKSLGWSQARSRVAWYKKSISGTMGILK